MKQPDAIVIGGGLAGCEAAWQLACRGKKVALWEMKPAHFSPAHSSTYLAELVCSNSLKASKEDSASGILKREMRRLGSLLLLCADKTAVPAGGALAVDRLAFAKMVTDKIEAHPNIERVEKQADCLPDHPYVIVATGPLTDGALAEEINALCGEPLSFYDAAAPIVSFESIDMSRAFFQGRYDQPADYLNCPMTKEEYDAFYQALMQAERAELHSFDVRHFEGCMPIEAIAARGYQTPLFGPMSPKGLTDPHTGRWPYAAVQLRREEKAGTMYNLVGFQTNLKFAEQKRVFGMIPALRNAEYLRYGVMHRNTYLPKQTLNDVLQLKARPNIRFAGQITGVEGYMESAAMGLWAGLCCALQMENRQVTAPDTQTAMGALIHYISEYDGKDYQPMNMNFGLMAPLETGRMPKAQKQKLRSEQAKQAFEHWMSYIEG